MDGDDLSIYGSKPFNFVVNDISIYIHRGLVRKVSKPLERLMSNGMSETRDGRAVLHDETEGTFTRFTHWAYAGFYNAAEFSGRPKIGAQGIDKITYKAAPVSLDPTPLPRRIQKSSAFGSRSLPPSRKETLKEAFLKLEFCEAGDERPSFVARANTTTSEDYTDVFLSHALLYAFAERWDIQPLKRLALKNLHQTLAAFTLWPECVEDVVELLRFAYEQTSLPESGQEPLRSMLNQYVTYEMDQMVQMESFRDFLEENREFLDDFCAHISKRI